MIKIENVVTPSPEQWYSIIMGMRNPMNSWAKSDSVCTDDMYKMGPNDRKLLMNLRNAGPSDRKVMRMIPVYLDITAPLYFFKEFDTYKVGTVANSCSTMHKIHAKEFVLEDFSTEHLLPPAIFTIKDTIKYLNYFRDCYLQYDSLKDGTIPASHEVQEILERISKKDLWWQMIQLLPSSYNQKRTIFLNYEVLLNMYHSRKNHKLDEWRTLCKWIETLPYSELITGKENEEEKKND